MTAMVGPSPLVVSSPGLTGSISIVKEQVFPVGGSVSLQGIRLLFDTPKIAITGSITMASPSISLSDSSPASSPKLFAGQNGIKSLKPSDQPLKELMPPQKMISASSPNQKFVD